MLFLLQRPPPTDITDIIGFLVSIAAVIFLIVRGLRAKKYREQHPEEVALEEEEQKETLKKFLKSLEMDMDETEEEEELERQRKLRAVKSKPKPPAPPQFEKPKPHRKVGDDYRFQSRVEQRKLETSIEKRRLESSVEARKQDFTHLVSDDLKAYSKQFTHTQPVSRGQAVVDRLKSKKDMFIFQQILNPPKAFEKDRFR